MFLVCLPRRLKNRADSYMCGGFRILVWCSCLWVTDNAKKFKLTISLAQIDWKISQTEAVQFCCCAAPCTNKFNFINCVFHDKNVQWKTTSSYSILVFSLSLVSVLLTSACTGNLTCVHGKLVIFEQKNGTMCYIRFGIHLHPIFLTFR